MNKELKAISLLHPHILDGDGKLTSGFIEEPDEIKTDLLSNISGVELFLRNADYANNIFNEYDYHSSDDLLEVFKLTSKSLLENLDIIKMAAVSNPVFLEAISKELITSEIILLAISTLETKFDDYTETDECAYNIVSALKNSKAWDDLEFLTKLEIVLDKSKWGNENPSNLGGTVFWIKLIDIAPQEVFDDLESLKSLLKIFISGISDDYDSDTVYEESFSFWDGFEWAFWSELIDFENFEQKITNSQHLQQEEIQSLVALLAKCIEEQETELEYYNENKPDKFIGFLKGINLTTKDFNEERSKKLANIKINGLAQENDEVKADRDLVLEMVKNDGDALQHASDELKTTSDSVIFITVIGEVILP